MKLLVAPLVALLVTTVPAPAFAQGEYMPTGSRISQTPGPRAFRPVKREMLDDAVVQLFRLADSNGDGLATLDEFNGIMAARRDQVVRDRFAAIDTNRDQSLSFAEFSQWQANMGSAVLSESEAAGGIELVSEVLTVNIGRSDLDEAIEAVLRPVTATALIEANADYDGGVSLAELLAWQLGFFDQADGNKDGWLTQDEYALLIEKGR